MIIAAFLKNESDIDLQAQLKSFKTNGSIQISLEEVNEEQFQRRDLFRIFHYNFFVLRTWLKIRGYLRIYSDNLTSVHSIVWPVRHCRTIWSLFLFARITSHFWLLNEGEEYRVALSYELKIKTWSCQICVFRFKSARNICFSNF